MIETEKRYSIRQAAQVSSLSKSTIQRALALGLETRGAAGLYPVERIGKRWLIPARTLEEYLQRYRLTA